MTADELLLAGTGAAVLQRLKSVRRGDWYQYTRLADRFTTWLRGPRRSARPAVADPATGSYHPQACTTAVPDAPVGRDFEQQAFLDPVTNPERVCPFYVA